MHNGKWIALKWMTLSLAALLGGSVLAIADDAAPPATTEPTTLPAEPRHERALVHPWNKLTDLAPDQKEKIEEIHTKSMQQRKILEMQERTDIMALLTPDQKEAVEAIEAKAAKARREAARKAREQNKADEAPATQPSN